MAQIFGYPYGPGFGDLWIYTNTLAQLSSDFSEVKFNPIPRMFSDRHPYDYYTKIILEILTHLEYDGTGKVIPVTDDPTQLHFRYKNFYCSTKVKHAVKNPTLIVYQEDPFSSKPKEENVKQFFECMKNHEDFTFKKIGLPMSMKQIIQTVSGARAFIGFESGMTHLCLSAGIPIYLTEIPSWYYSGTYGINLCSSVSEMFNKACEGAERRIP